MKTEKILLTVTVLAAAALTRFRMVGHDGNVPDANDPVLGVANADYAAGEQAGVAVHGEILVEAGGPIDVGGPINTDSVGRAVASFTGERICGIARDAASAAGDVIRMIAIPTGSDQSE